MQKLGPLETQGLVIAGTVFLRSLEFPIRSLIPDGPETHRAAGGRRGWLSASGLNPGL